MESRPTFEGELFPITDTTATMTATDTTATDNDTKLFFHFLIVAGENVKTSLGCHPLYFDCVKGSFFLEDTPFQHQLELEMLTLLYEREGSRAATVYTNPFGDIWNPTLNTPNKMEVELWIVEVYNNYPWTCLLHPMQEMQYWKLRRATMAMSGASDSELDELNQGVYIASHQFSNRCIRAIRALLELRSEIERTFTEEQRTQANVRKHLLQFWINRTS